MNYFQYRNGELCCEDLPLKSIAERFGTPCYVYSHQTIARHYYHLINAWHPLEVMITYSVKANSNLAILSLFRKFNAWIDVVSRGEIYRAIKAGFPPERIVFGGVGKTGDEIRYAIDQGIFLIIIDSEPELEILSRLAKKKKRRVNVAIRINPAISIKTHPHIATGLRQSKFGIDMSEAVKIYRKAFSLASIAVVGVHHHIGSQVIALEPFLDALTKTADLVRRLRGYGIPLEYVDIGGGIGITYRREAPFALEDFADRIRPIIQRLGLKLIIEPGRVIMGNAGILLTRVTYIKSTRRKKFVIVDAGMNDLLRPVLYDAYHEIRSCRKISAKFKADVVGPICESGDFFARDRVVPGFKQGDLAAIMSAGAYGFSMSSNYNSRPRPAEILVKGRKAYLVRRRETDEDLIRNESIPEFLK